jgi:hypothetical protein
MTALAFVVCQEYKREDILWKFIYVLDLIYHKHTGILVLLDEQCIFSEIGLFGTYSIVRWRRRFGGNAVADVPRTR